MLILFPPLAPAAAAAGYAWSELFALLQPGIVPLLMLIMLCMGLTLTPRDFLEVGRYRGALLAGVGLQFLVMPLAALLVASVAGLSDEMVVGMVLVGSVAGGTSSNVMTYLARGHVALSISMTAFSTVLSIAMTPLLLTLLVGSRVLVPASDILVSLLQIILLPVLAGVLCNHYAGRWVRRVQPVLAPLAMLVILVIIACVVALNAGALVSVGPAIIVATLVHNLTGLALGYLAAMLLGFERAVCRTIALEVGMQNSGLATALALKFFSPLAALPGAVFSVWLNITGALFVTICGRFAEDRGETGSAAYE